MNARKIGISALAYYLAPEEVSVDALEKEGRLSSDASVLKSFGFKNIRRVSNETHLDLAKKAVQRLLKPNKIDPLQIDVLLFAGATTPSSMMYSSEFQSVKSHLNVKNVMDFFKYPVSRIQYDFGMSNAAVIGLGQQGCSSLFSAIRVAKSLILAEPGVKKVLCVSSDVFPAKAIREVVYNVLSDAACAFIVEESSSNQILEFTQITKGYYWDCELLQNELIAAYFPTAKRVIQDTMKKANLTVDDIKILIPHNVSMRSWDILLGLVGFPKERFFGQNIAKIGHSIGADNIINLKDAIDSGVITKGENILMFNFGFGVNWSCIILKH